jgi:Ca2+-binding RTX toxin-like protein
VADFTGTGGDDAQGGTAANESFDFSQGGDDTLTGGAGNDTFKMGASFGDGDSVDGGDGFDTLDLNGDYAALDIGLNITGIEQVKLAAGHDYEIDIAAVAVGAAGMKVDGSSLGVGETLDIAIDAAATGPLEVLSGAGADVISLSLSDAGSKVSAGAGDDNVTVLGGTITDANLSGGDGTDTLALGDATLAVSDFSASTTGFEAIDLGKVTADDAANAIDLASFDSADADDAYNVRGEGGDDVVTGLDDAAGKLHGNEGDDALTGGNLADRLRGNRGDDGLAGGTGNDLIKGGEGVDELDGGNGQDTFYYAKVIQSTGRGFDVITGFNADEDSIGFIGLAKPAAIDAAITSGSVGSKNFNTDLETAVDGAHLGAGNAVLFTADAGRFAGRTFLVIDANGTAGYQSGEDFLIGLSSASNLANLDLDNFVTLV